MPSDLNQMFQQLGRDSVADFLASPSDVRRAGTRRTRVRRAGIAGAGAACVAALALMFNAGLPLSLGSTPIQPGAISSVPSGPANAPSTIADSAFLTAADSFGEATTIEDGPSGDDESLPNLCGATFGGTSQVVAARVGRLTYHRTPTDAANGYTPEGSVYTRITLFSGDGAQQLLASVRAAVAACPTETVSSVQHDYALGTTTLPGDDSVTVVETSHYASGNVETPFYVVRSGTAVLAFSMASWEGLPIDEQRAAEVRDRVIERFLTWASQN